MRKPLAAVTATAVIATAAFVGAGLPAAAAEGTEEGIGARKAYQFEERRLNDRMAAKVNVATGNLLLQGKDLEIKGTGLSAKVTRYYNSLSTADAPLGPGWLLGVGRDVRLDVSGTEVVFHAPSGYLVTFTEGTDGFTAEEPGLDAELTRRNGGGYRLEWRSKEKWFFDDAGSWTSQEDANGNTLTFDYVSDASTSHETQLSTLTDTRGRTVTFDYDKGRLTSAYDAAGGRTYTYTYDKSDRLTAFAVTSYGLGNDNVNKNATTSFSYDDQDRLTTVTDPRGNSTLFGYSGDDRRVASLTRVLDPNAGTGPTTRFTYKDTVDECADESEAVAETVVDGPRTQVQDLTTFCVDKHDRVVATIDAKGHKAGKKYTSNSNVATLNESGVAGGPSYDFSFSQNGDNLTGVSLPTGGKASLDYDDADNQHLVTGVTDFASGPEAAPTWLYDYDDDGNLIEARNDSEDITYRYCYNGDGTVARVAQPPLDGVGLDEDLDADGCAGQAQGNDSLMTYNADGELVRFNPPGPHRTRTFTYDALSRVRTSTDGRGVVQTFAYDALDRVTSVRYEEPATSTKVSKLSSEGLVLVPPDDEDTKQTWINYSHDPNGNLLARSDAAGNTTYQYDPLNRMTKESPESPSAVVTYTYDPAGNVTTIATSDAPAPTQYTFDETNLTSSVTDPEGRVTRFGYDKSGNRTSTTYPNGVAMKARFDDSDRMACTYAFTGTDPATGTDCPSAATDLVAYFRYRYEATLGGVVTDTNRRESVVDRSGAETVYGYDAIGRLVDATTTDTAGTTTRRHQFTYDSRSNLTRENVSGSQATAETRSQAYSPGNELCWVADGDHAPDCGSAPAGAQEFSYDAAGAMTRGSGLQVGYSLRGQTVTVTPPGLDAITMEYADATQDRRTEAGGIRMSYSQLGLVQQAPTNSAADSTWFVRDPGQRLVGMLHADPGKADLYYVFDGLGSVVATTDTDGSVVDRYRYEPYGEQLAPDADDENPWRYAAGYYDKATGMVKFGTRYYLPDVARWSQPDPVQGELRNPVTLNTYGYVGGDPVNYVDPTGRLLDDLLSLYDDVSLLQDADSIFEGGVTAEEAGTFIASEGAGLVTETACMFAAGYFTAGLAFAAAPYVCFGLGELASWGVEEAMS